MSDVYNVAANQVQPQFFSNFLQGQQQGQQQRAQNALQQQLPGILRQTDPAQQQDQLATLAGSNPQAVPGVQQMLANLNDQQKQQVAQKADAMVRTLVGIHSIQDPAQKAQAWQQAKQQAIASGLQGAAQLSDDPEQGIAQAYSHVAPLAEIGRELDFGQAEAKMTPVNVPQSDGSYVLMMSDGKGGLTRPSYPDQPAPTQGTGSPATSSAQPTVSVNVNPMSEQEATRAIWSMEGERGQPFSPNERQQILNAMVKGVPYGPQAPSQAPQGTQAPAANASAAPPSTAPSPAYAAAGTFLGGTPPVMGVKPAAGHEAPSGYQWNPEKTALIPIPGGPADKTSQPVGLGDESKTGQAYLDSIADPGLKAYLQGIVLGHNKPENFRTPTGSQITPMQIAIAASRVDPSFSVTDFNTRNDALKSFKDGKDAANVQALNQLGQHLDQLSAIAPKLSGIAIPFVGGAVNSVVNNAEDVSDGNLTSWKATADAVAHEARAVFNNNKGSGTQSELDSNLAVLSGNASAAQKQAALKSIASLVGSRIGIIDKKYQDALGRGAVDSGILPETRQMLSTMSGRNFSAPAAPTNTSQSTPPDVQALLDKYLRK